MVVDSGILSRVPAWPPMQVGALADHQRDLLRHAHGLSVADVAQGLPPWQTVYGYFWRWTRSGLWYRINSALVKRVRMQHGRPAQPSAAILDSQSVKTSEDGEARGVDVHKQTPGRKRHIV